MSTATAPATAPASGPGPDQADQVRAPRERISPTTQRSLKAMVGVGLSAVPLAELFTDRGWLIDIWVAILVAMLPALLIRLRWPARLVDLLPGLVLAALWLTSRFVSDHALGGIIPTGRTLTDLSTLVTGLQNTAHDQVAPIHTTVAVRLGLAAGFAVLALLVDAIAVVGGQPAIAGVPLLLVFTLAGAVPRHPVGWLLFVPAAIGFLLLLSCNANSELPRWGRMMPRTQATPGRSLALSGRRIGVIAIAVAVAVPLLLPGRSTNLVSDALHDGAGDGSGTGSGHGGVRLNPFVSLKGDLQRGDPVALYSVHITGVAGTARPYYLRDKVLDTYAKDGFRAGPDGAQEDLGSSAYSTQPSSSGLRTNSLYDATITTTGGRDNPPIFGFPTAVTGLDGGNAWDPRNGLVTGTALSDKDTYAESVAQPDPSPTALAADGSPPPDAALAAWTQLPALPKAVSQLAATLKSQSSSRYDLALRILQYLSPADGFTYSLQTKDGDSGSDLQDFLTNKVGFCQQYAATMAVLLRADGVPTRVVLGYTHSAADASGNFVVTTDDAHAWVEVFFPSTGWVPFDPTPLGSVDPGRAVALPYAQPTTGAPSSAVGNDNRSDRPSIGQQSVSVGAPAQAVAGPTSGSGLHLSWQSVGIAVAVVLVMLLLLVPAAVRRRRRRARLRAAEPDPLWAELSATAEDLGYVWSTARTPRQVVSWLTSEAGLGGAARGALGTLAGAVEQSRYATRMSHGSDTLVENLRTVESGLRDHRGRRARFSARFTPASLGWTVLGRRRH